MPRKADHTGETMGEPTSKERDRCVEKDQARYFHLYKQILSNPEYRKAWDSLEELKEEERQATEKVKKIEKEMFEHGQVRALLRDHKGPGLRSTDPVWGPKVKKWRKALECQQNAKARYSETYDALRSRSGLSILGPREGETIADLQRVKWEEFLASPESVQGQRAVEPVFRQAPDPDERLKVSRLLFPGNRLVMVLHLDHSNQAILADVEGWLRFIRCNTTQLGTHRVHLNVEERRSKVFALKALGWKRKQIAEKIFPEEMKSKNPKICKRAAQRITYILHPRKK